MPLPTTVSLTADYMPAAFDLSSPVAPAGPEFYPNPDDPTRIVWADIYRVGSRHMGWQAIRSHFSTWAVELIADMGPTRHLMAEVRADFPGRVEAERYVLTLIAAHTPAIVKAA